MLLGCKTDVFKLIRRIEKVSSTARLHIIGPYHKAILTHTDPECNGVIKLGDVILCEHKAMQDLTRGLILVKYIYNVSYIIYIIGLARSGRFTIFHHLIQRHLGRIVQMQREIHLLKARIRELVHIT